MLLATGTCRKFLLKWVTVKLASSKKIIRTKHEGFRVEVQLCRNTFVTPAVSETVSGLLDRGWQRQIQICPEIAQKKTSSFPDASGCNWEENMRCKEEMLNQCK